jgi:hypothetical protein
MEKGTALLPGVPLIDSPFFEGDAPHLLTEDQLRVARDLNQKGYAVIDFPDPDIGNKIDRIKTDLNTRYDWPAWESGKTDNLRIQDAWRFNEDVRSIAANAKVMELLSAIYQKPALPFQSLNFPVGTQQPAHSDHAHFNSVPDRFMCGVWLAFEDITEENGPLFYYPGSHKWPSYQNEHLGVSYRDIVPGYPGYGRYVALWDALMQAQGLQREVFLAKKGQALIWTSNLLHGGSPHNNKQRTRWSQVTHYFFEGCAYTTPLANDTYQGKILFRDIINIASEKPVQNIVSGEPLRPEFHAAVKDEFRPSRTGRRGFWQKH